MCWTPPSVRQSAQALSIAPTSEWRSQLVARGRRARHRFPFRTVECGETPRAPPTRLGSVASLASRFPVQLPGQPQLKEPRSDRAPPEPLVSACSLLGWSVGSSRHRSILVSLSSSGDRPSRCTSTSLHRSTRQNTQGAATLRIHCSGKSHPGIGLQVRTSRRHHAYNGFRSFEGATAAHCAAHVSRLSPRGQSHLGRPGVSTRASGVASRAVTHM